LARIIDLQPGVAVAYQLVEADFDEVAARGFRSVVNNRPDGEAPGQLPNARAEAAAASYGLQYRYLPVTNMNVTDDDVVAAFARLMDELPAPILFYCRTGTRCATLWTQVAAGRIGIEPALRIAAGAGYDLEVLRDDLVNRFSMPTHLPAGTAVIQDSSSRPPA
jgi:sulfide:quinone oxidoreductase